MCGRFTLTTPDYKTLIQIFGAGMKAEDARLYRPRFNIAPADPHWILADRDGQRQLLPAKWGVPTRFRTGPASQPKTLINARLETASEKPTFREAFQKRRCAIPADGFYEWKIEGKRKQPYWFHAPDNEIFLFAGLFETDPVLSFTILTMTADKIVAPIHARMPVALDSDQIDLWLKQARIGEAGVGFSLQCHAVSFRVNSTQNDDPDCLRVDETARRANIARYP